MQSVVDTQVTELAATFPKSTVSVEAKPVPVIVTRVPPATDPLLGLIAVTAGGLTADAGVASTPITPIKVPITRRGPKKIATFR